MVRRVYSGSFAFTQARQEVAEFFGTLVGSHSLAYG